MVCNTAVFYDIENLIGLFSTKNNTILQLDEIYRRILETEGVTGVSIQKAYTDWGVQINRNLRNYVLQIGIEPVQIFNTNQNDKVKNASDVSLIIDAVDLIQKRPDIENYVIVSGDGIFAFLAKKLHEYGKRVIGVGFLRNSNIIFRNACDYYISLEKDDKTLTATSNKSTLKGQSAVAQAQTAITEQTQGLGNTLLLVSAQQEETTEQKQEPKPAVKKQGKLPASFPKSKYTEILVKSGFTQWHKQQGEQNHNGGLLAIRNLINTLFENTAGGEGNGGANNNANSGVANGSANGGFPNGSANNANIGVTNGSANIANSGFANGSASSTADLEISVLKTYVDYFVPGFRVSQYKFKRFGEFMQFIVTGSPYCLYMHDGTILRITRRGTVGGRGKLMDDCKGLVITLANGQKLKSVFDVPDGTAFTYSLAEQENPPQNKAKQKAASNGKQAAKVQAAALETARAMRAEGLTAYVPTPEAEALTDDVPTPEAEALTAYEPTPEAEAPTAYVITPEAEAPTESATAVKVPAAIMPTVTMSTADIADTAANIAAVQPEADMPVNETSDSGSVRKMIKNTFVKLMSGNKLSADECKRLASQDYSQKTFGVRAPIFRELAPRANLQEQRKINGNIRYWKEVFEFNGKSYLVFKEWSVLIHKDRFDAWAKKYES